MTLTGFTDAGRMQQQLTAMMTADLEGDDVVSFSADILLDYRARRPVMHFEGDHFDSYQAPELSLTLREDELGNPFLHLHGFEPDFAWDAFADDIIAISDRLSVASTTIVNAVPMPVPHTRPIRMTVSGNRPELIERMSMWRPSSHIVASVMHVIEYRMQQSGRPVTGITLLVPHYLAETEIPGVCVTAIEAISSATGLVLPTDELRDLDRDFLARVDEQVAQNEELQSLITSLEERMDEAEEGSPQRSPLMSDDGSIPSAEMLATELENFLADQRRRDDE